MKACCFCKKEFNHIEIVHKFDNNLIYCSNECKDNDKKRRASESKKQNYLKNRDKILEKARGNQIYITRCKEYREKNRDILLEKMRKYKKNNREKIKLSKKIYREENKDIENERYREYMSDPTRKVIKKVRDRVWEICKNKNFKKTENLDKYLGCTKEELIKYLESKFKPDMNWDNYGSLWHIDHMIPLNNANTPEKVIELSHYLNLTPLYKTINLEKNDTASKCWQKLRKEITEKEDTEAGMPFNLNVSDFAFNQEEFSEEHKIFIERYEWLKTIGYSAKYIFTARYNNLLAGVLIMGIPPMFQFDKELEITIQRGAVSSWAPKNLNSSLVMFSCRWIVKNTNKRIFTAYSDHSAGEIGTIYQACNFDFLGSDYGTRELFTLENGKKVSARYFTKTSSIKKWAKQLNIPWEKEWCNSKGYQDIKKIPREILLKLRNYGKELKNKCPKEKVAAKGKYVLLLNYGKNKVKKTWISKPYPKRKYTSET